MRPHTGPPQYKFRCLSIVLGIPTHSVEPLGLEESLVIPDCQCSSNRKHYTF